MKLQTCIEFDLKEGRTFGLPVKEEKAVEILKQLEELECPVKSRIVVMDVGENIAKGRETVEEVIVTLLRYL